MIAADRAVGAPERLHPLFLLTGLGKSLRGLAGAYAGIVYLAATGRLRIALVGLALLLAGMAISLVIYWRRFEYRVGTSEIRIDSGILTRTHRSIPFDRIQDVDIIQGPIARLLGLATVKFETGSAGSAKNDEGVLQAISLKRAQQLRALVRAHRAPALPIPGGASEDAETEHELLYAMSRGRVQLAGLFGFSLAVFGGLAGLTQLAGDVIGFDPFSRSFWSGLSKIGGPWAAFLMANALASAVGGVLLLALVGAATGMVRSVLRYHGFRLDRAERALRRRSGLLTLTDVTLPLARIQAAVLATGPVRRRFGWFELGLQSLARDEGGKGDHVVAPLADYTEAGRIIASIGWPEGPSSPKWHHVSRAYLYLFLIALAPVAVLGVVQTLIVPLAGFAIVGVVMTAAALRILAWPRTRYMLDGKFLFVEGGWWRQHRLQLPLAKVQSADVSDNLITRLFGVATLELGVAGGGGGFAGHRVPALPRSTAFSLRSQLLGWQ